MIINRITIFFVTLMVLSCDSSDDIRTYRLPKIETTNLTHTVMESEIHPTKFIWEKPVSWIPTKGSSMRLASFGIPYSGGSGDLSVIQLNGNGGGIESNVNRWRRQLHLESESLIEIEKNILIRKGMLGRYNYLKIINQQLDSAFLCAIIPNENQTIFVKLSLKPNGIIEIEDDFITFCSSINISN